MHEHLVTLQELINEVGLAQATYMLKTHDNISLGKVLYIVRQKDGNYLRGSGTEGDIKSEERLPRLLPPSKS